MILEVVKQRKHQCCYILDYQLYKPGDDRMLSTEFSGKVIRRNKQLGLNEYKFLLKAIVSSGIGEQTYAPKMVFCGREANPTYDDAITEMDEFLHDSIEKLLSRTGVSPLEIDVLVDYQSLQDEDDIKAYSLTGMGCSAS
ncbi:unnamed protein product [Ilex paraguariensis]|uniref:FAE domain-containing protein n=1 Tax=Ilex paraguariensis TaxID=185542 RepID=A0ABC8S250_9AQUA